MAQITRTVAERPDVPFADILDEYRKDLIGRNQYALDIRVDPEYAGVWTLSYIQEHWPIYDRSSVRVLMVEDGNGRHTHDNECKPANPDIGCLMHLSDSDWIVTLAYDTLPQYGPKTHRAVYGVIDGNFTLWAD